MRWRSFIGAWTVLWVAGCATPSPEPFEDDDTIVYMAVRADDLDAYWAWLSEQAGAPVQYRSIRFRFPALCGTRGDIALRLGAGSELERSPFTQSFPGWYIGVDRIYLGWDPAPRAFGLEGVAFTGYDRIALTSADRVEQRYGAIGTSLGLPVPDPGSATYLGGYRLTFDAESGAFQLHFDPDGPVLPGLAVEPLQAAEPLCEGAELAQ